MSSIIEDWCLYLGMSKGRQPSTVSKYEGYLKRLSDWLDRQGKSLLSASVKDLETFTGIHAHREGLAPQSRRALIAAVRSFYRWAFGKQLRNDDPGRPLELPKAGKPLPRQASLSSAEKLLMQPDLDKFTGVRDAAILGLLIGCGFRITGLLNLNESNLLWYMEDGAERLIIRTVEKGNKERFVPVVSEARLLLRAYLGHSDLGMIDRTLPNSDQVLFVSTRNYRVPEQDYRGETRRLSRVTVDNMIKRYGRLAGIPPDQRHAHAFRHLVGVELYEHHQDLNLVKSVLGHENIDTTTIYTRMATRSMAKALDASSPLRNIKTPVSEIVKRIERH